MFKAKIKMIAIVVLLMAAAIYIFDDSIKSDNEVSTQFQPTAFESSLPAESGVFKRGSGEVDFENMLVENANRRSLKEYYENRAYSGAPPVIPHPLLSEKGIGDKSCLQCHQNGGYTAVFKAYAPITPHAELVNCKQCHVPVRTNKLFVQTNWEKSRHPELGGAVLLGGPPPIPHSLQMRENCLACHAGPATPKELLVSHPERVNCRQCHVLSTKTTNFIKWDSIPSSTKRSKIEWEKLSQ